MVVETKLSLKEMWKFIVRMSKINMIILNEYYKYLLCILIIDIIRIFIYFQDQRQFDVFEYEYVCNEI